MKPEKLADHHGHSAVFCAIESVVAGIPAGQVMSYGDVARAAGHPRHARMVARVLKQSRQPLPWFRVVRSDGRIAARGLDGEDDLQRMLLEEEGIAFDARGRIDLTRYRGPEDGRDQAAPAT